jgi:hypothetical protein
MNTPDLHHVTGLHVYPASVSEAGGATWFLGKRGTERLVGCAGGPCLPSAKKVGELAGRCVCAGPTDAANAAAIRKALPWTAPRCLGLAGSAGFGDRLGIATPAHIRAVRGTGIAPVLAQQSIREMTRTGRAPREVLDAATWGVLQEGWREGFGADADHVHKPEDLAACAEAGFTMFTIDPGPQVRSDADRLEPAELERLFDADCAAGLESSPADLKRRYVGKRFPLAASQGAAAAPAAIEFDELTLLRASAKYGRAIAHVAMMYRRLAEAALGPFELEVSVDETASPTSPEEHYFIASELYRLGVRWVSLAPRFPGRFEKGVEYIGDLDEFRRSFALHVAVMRTLGPYKLSLHSGSDKFRLYPIVAELAGGLFHLKTAGTSYVEALRAAATIDPSLFRRILAFARGRYEEDRASYLVSADLARVPDAAQLADALRFPDAALPGLLDDLNIRQVLHVTFGSVLSAGGGCDFRDPLLAALLREEETFLSLLESHLAKHLRPFAR